MKSPPSEKSREVNLKEKEHPGQKPQGRGAPGVFRKKKSLTRSDLDH